MGSRGGARSSPGWSLSPWEPRRPDRGGQRATPRVAWRRRHRDPAEGPRPPGAGSLLLTIGLLRWIPRPVRLEEIRRELARANERLEQRVEEATRDRPSARNSWSWRSAPPTWSSTRWIPTACSRSRTTAASDGSAWNPARSWARTSGTCTPTTPRSWTRSTRPSTASRCGSRRRSPAPSGNRSSFRESAGAGTSRRRERALAPSSPAGPSRPDGTIDALAEDGRLRFVVELPLAGIDRGSSPTGDRDVEDG